MDSFSGIDSLDMIPWQGKLGKKVGFQKEIVSAKNVCFFVWKYAKKEKKKKTRTGSKKER